MLYIIISSKCNYNLIIIKSFNRFIGLMSPYRPYFLIIDRHLHLKLYLLIKYDLKDKMSQIHIIQYTKKSNL